MRLKLATLITLFLGLTLTPAAVGAVDLLPQCQNNQSTICKDVSKGKGTNPVTDTIGKATRVIGYITGIAAVIMVIVGGLRYITADGDSTKITTGRKMITYALVGIVISLLASSITQVLTGKLF